MFVFLHNIWDDIVVKYCKRGKSCNSDNGQITPRRNAKSLARLLMQKDEDYAEENDLTYEEIDECHHYDKLDVSLKDIDTVSKTPHGRLLEQRQCLLFQGYDSSRLAQDTLQ